MVILVLVSTVRTCTVDCGLTACRMIVVDPRNRLPSIIVKVPPFGNHPCFDHPAPTRTTSGA